MFDKILATILIITIAVVSIGLFYLNVCAWFFPPEVSATTGVCIAGYTETVRIAAHHAVECYY